jgi:DNA polymerase-3 subunit delta
MGEETPVVYILHGDDEFAIAQFLSEAESRLGDVTVVAMNTTRLDGRSYNPDSLLGAACAMPFLARRRMVVLTNPLTKLSHSAARKKFLEDLGKIPQSTALFLVEEKPLVDWRERRKGQIHWLEKWAKEAGGRAYLREFTSPKGAQLVSRIQEMAVKAGGKITPAAAEHLGSLVYDDLRMADQEIQKLLAYVNYSRAIEREDVEQITADMGQGDIFAMVDALGSQDGRNAIRMLQRLLDQQDPFSIFGMIVRQFRLLLLTRETLDQGGQKTDVVSQVKVAPFVAEKLIGQVRHFSLPDLQMIFRRLLDMDEAIKTGQVPADLALQTLIAALTAK